MPPIFTPSPPPASEHDESESPYDSPQEDVPKHDHHHPVPETAPPITLKEAITEFAEALHVAAGLGEDVMVELLMGWAEQLRLKWAYSGRDDGRTQVGAEAGDDLEERDWDEQEDNGEWDAQEWQGDGGGGTAGDVFAGQQDDEDEEMSDDEYWRRFQEAERRKEEEGSVYEDRGDEPTEPEYSYQGLKQHPSETVPNRRIVNKPPTYTARLQHTDRATLASTPPPLPQPSSSVQVIKFPTDPDSPSFKRGLTAAELNSLGIKTRRMVASFESALWNSRKWTSVRIALRGVEMVGDQRCLRCKVSSSGRYDGCFVMRKGEQGPSACGNCMWRKVSCSLAHANGT
ncbi:hypothetical protein BJ508DRAFT_414707 [Ascobolus immersus RN42]|uniref:Uncharacterized protein n=1 Tax=Ascobolus immersus RN42 TaxID=1160509 RepID=A0A3N4IIH2_ASCIM|nr:hypothetical protein BJ508DRAFT_414707 [Ascobolus immersus RN42]